MTQHRGSQPAGVSRHELVLHLAEPAATDALGAALARTLPWGARDGSVVHLAGELGAGKTSCVRSLLRALCVRGLIRSPTYTLLEVYETAAGRCVHLDLYRVRSSSEVEELGLRDHLGAGVVLLVEWPDRGATAVPPADLAITFEYCDNGRRASLDAATEVGRRWLADLENDPSLGLYVSNLT